MWNAIVAKRNSPEESSAFGSLDRTVSKAALVLGCALSLLIVTVSLSNGFRPDDLIWAAGSAGFALAGALNLYLSGLWGRPGISLWQRGLIIIVKPMLVIVLFPVMLFLIPLFFLYLIAIATGLVHIRP